MQKETKTDERYRARRALNVQGVSRGRRGSRADPSRCQINGATLRVRTATSLMQFRNSPVLAHFVFALHDVLSPCWPLVFEVSVFPLEFRPVCRAFYPSFCGRRQSLISHRRRRRSAATHASRAAAALSLLHSAPHELALKPSAKVIPGLPDKCRDVRSDSDYHDTFLGWAWVQRYKSRRHGLLHLVLRTMTY